jgi:transcriptional regulator with AAA-type ATPase domain
MAPRSVAYSFWNEYGIKISRVADPGSRLRLKGPIGDALRTFVLPPREVSVGSAAQNDIVLPVPEVSRQHAMLRPAEDAVEVRDLESKNGVYVNERRVSTATLAPGDEVRFGPVALRLEAIDARDLELALPLGGSIGGPVLSDEHARATQTWEGDAPVAWLPLLERAVPLLRSGPAGLGAALTLLTEEAGLQGCAVAEVRHGALVMLGAAGALGTLDEKEVLEEAGRGGQEASLRSGGLASDPDISWAATGASPRILMARARPNSRPVEPALRVLVQLAAWSDGASGASPTPRASPARGLVFPSRHVRGTSPPMAELYAQMEPIADTDLPILVIGETGVGKEDFARALHLSSSRAQGPFVAVNCAAIPAELLEAELFGVGKGAATGVNPRPGRFQLAHGGTLFLDEIGDMPLMLQAKLLRVLETGEVEPLASRPVSVDLRVVSATHVDVASRIEGGQFRADLYYRLCGAVLAVPPLRRRRGDIPGLADGILRPLAVASAKPIRGVTAKALAALVDHDWPGNVRELEHELQRLFHACPAGEAIEFGMLPEAIRAPKAPARVSADETLELQRHVDALENRLIAEALARTHGNRTEAARLLAISRNGLALKMARLGLGD